MAQLLHPPLCPSRLALLLACVITLCSAPGSMLASAAPSAFTEQQPTRLQGDAQRVLGVDGIARASSTVDVVVVGAGYSGLVAARDLTRAGYSVAVVS